ncbi:unnamed protein product, partial [Rotaria magnacalcarata]
MMLLLVIYQDGSFSFVDINCSIMFKENFFSSDPVINIAKSSAKRCVVNWKKTD